MAKREYYLEESEKVSNELKKLLLEESGWTLKKDSKTCKVYNRPIPGRQDLYVWKGVSMVPIQSEKIFDMVHPTAQYRPMWDPNLAWCRLLEEVNDNVFVTHQCTKAQLLGLLSARDTTDIFKLEDTDEYFSSQFGSIEYENAQKVENSVRAWSYPSGIFIFKNDANSAKTNPTRVVTFFQADGRLDVVPPAVLNAAMPTFVKQYFKALWNTEKIAWTPLTDVSGRRQMKH